MATLSSELLPRRPACLTASNQSKEKTLYLEKAWPLLSAASSLF
jgi:hypothetical protein